MSELEPTFDVLVVGAGPTGLMLANWLTKLGVSAAVVDGKSGPTVESRALGVQARTMEIYDQLGVVDTVLAASQQAAALAPGFEDRAFGRIPIGELGSGVTPYPRIYVLEQSRNEEILYANLRALGGDVRWGHPLTGLAVSDGVVVATVAGPDGDVQIRARYCVGADGASSAVRQLREIGFEGLTSPQRFYVADATEVHGLRDGAVNVRLGERDFLLTFPMAGPGHWRLIGTVRDEDADDQLTERDVRARLSQVYGVAFGPVKWFATYRVHHRVAAQFRDGPFFLAGDAAHVHSPVGAQGMNTGLQDAHNLAFKLADVTQGRAGDDWLDRYAAERRPVAKRLIATTDRLFRAATSDRRLAQTLRRLAVPLLAPIAVGLAPRASAGPRLFQYVSQIRIHYWMSDEAKQARHGRRGQVVGRRLPWTGDNFAALRSLRWQVHGYGSVDPAVAKSLEAELDLPVHVFPPAPAKKLRDGLLYLVRPDGFVAAAARPADAVPVFASIVPGAGAGIVPGAVSGA